MMNVIKKCEGHHSSESAPTIRLLLPMFSSARFSSQAVCPPPNTTTLSGPCELFNDIRTAATAEAVATAAVAAKIAAVIELKAVSAAASALLDAERGCLQTANAEMMHRHEALFRAVERCHKDRRITINDREDLARRSAALGLLDSCEVDSSKGGNLTDVNFDFFVSGQGGSSKAATIPAAKAKAAAHKTFNEANMTAAVLKLSDGASACVSADFYGGFTPPPKEEAPVEASAHSEEATAAEWKLIADQRSRLETVHALFQARAIERGNEGEIASSAEGNGKQQPRSFTDLPIVAPHIQARKKRCRQG